MRWLDGITDSMDMNLGKLQEVVRAWQAWCAVVHGVTKSGMTWQLNDNNKGYIVIRVELQTCRPGDPGR